MTPDGWLVKGGGAAHTREKAVAAAAARFVVIVSSDKLVDRLVAARAARAARVRSRRDARATRSRRRCATSARSPDGGVIADYTGEFDDPEELAALLAGTVGVVEHGLFPPSLVSDVIVANGGIVETRSVP